jgi:hypothetical protein
MPTRDHPAVKMLDEQYQEIEKRNAEVMERQNKAKPTPTQAENDLARLGALDPFEPKEDHGAESEYEMRKRGLEEDMRRLDADEKRRKAAEDRRKAEADDDRKNRAMTPGPNEPGYQTRGPGRPPNPR